jgi:hypothetical protein
MENNKETREIALAMWEDARNWEGPEDDDWPEAFADK